MITSMSLVRAIHFASCMLLLGGFVFRLVVAGPVFRHAEKDARLAFDPLDKRLRNLATWSLAVSFVSGCFWLWLVAARVSGANLISAVHPEILGTLLGRTYFGRLWEVRLAIIAGFVALVFVRQQWGQFVKLLLAAALLAALSLAGHAGASIGEARWIQLANDAFHLIAAGTWPAGLAPFALFLAQALQADQPDEMQVAALVTRRFSSLSLVTVGTLAITGTVNGYFLVGTFHALVATVYGRLLLLKLGLFGAMVVIGAFNLLWLKPRTLVAAKSTALGKSSNLLRSLRRNVLTELSLGTIVIIVVGVLGVTPPAAHFEKPTGISIPHDGSRTSAAQRFKVLSPAFRSSLDPNTTTH
jgi:putative copper resistance protein D